MKKLLYLLVFMGFHAKAIREIVSGGLCEMNPCPGWLDSAIQDPERKLEQTVEDNSALPVPQPASLEMLCANPSWIDVLMGNHMQPEPEDDSQTVKLKRRVQKLETRERARQAWQQCRRDEHIANKRYHASKK